MKLKPKTKTGKLSVLLSILFIITIFTSIILVTLGILSFEVGHWWDITVAISFPMEIISLILGIIALRKKDFSTLVYMSVAIGIITILFILLHSLFIND